MSKSTIKNFEVNTFTSKLFIQIGLILFSIISSFEVFTLKAQLNGWPLSTHGSTTVTASQTWCTDRARITGETGGLVKTLTITDFTGSFTQGDWVIVIQMVADPYSIMGRHTLCEVVSTGTVSSPASSIQVKEYIAAGYTNNWPSFQYGINDRVQIVKVARFWNLTINSGIIDCPAFDHNSGTGGILAIMVGNNFTMNGGYINVHAKGFYSYFNTGGLGQGGTGATAAASHIPGGTGQGGQPASVDNTLYPLYFNDVKWFNNLSGKIGEPNGVLKVTGGINPDIFVGNKGSNGGIANNVQNQGTNTTFEIRHYYSHSIYPTDLHLGCSGECGSKGGIGAGGGGWGGTGGATCTLRNPVILGQPGQQGQNGSNGGNAGHAGRGGGILLLKVANSSLNFTNNQTRFYATGSSGENGGTGGDGGLGGKGGDGGNGHCNNGILPPGGKGGFGDGGKGADGGDAGSGGCGGTVWIIKKSGGTHSNFQPYVSNSKGSPGTGGSPGYTHTVNKVARSKNFSPVPLSAMPCNPGGTLTMADGNVCIPLKCDCDEVFRHLGSDMNGAISISTAGTNWEISKPGQESVFWNKVNLLYYTRVLGNCTTRYECKMKNQTLYSTFMDIAFRQIDLKSYNGSPLNAGVSQTNMSAGKTQLFAPGMHKVFEYDPITDRLTNYDDLSNPYVDVDVCSLDQYKISTGGGSGGGSNGDDNVTEDEVLVDKTPTGGYGENGNDQQDGNYNETDEQTPPPVNFNYDSYSNTGQIFFIQDDGYIHMLTGENNNEVSYTLIDASSKIIKSGKAIDKIPVHNIPTGFYIISIKTPLNSISRKIYLP